MEILECLQFGRSSKKYPPNVRVFALTLHYYSPNAYEYLRNVFNYNLPHIRTIKYWYTAIDGSPGYTKESFDVLSQRVKNQTVNKDEKKLLVGLCFDEMFIRKHSQFDAAKKEYLGHVTAGKPGEYQFSTPLCKEALVFMVTGIGQEFKLPIAYFLTNGLCKEEKTALINECLCRLHQIGVTAVSLTFDGAIVNIATAKLLGVDFKRDRPYFWHPCDKRIKVYIILDPPHMLKLWRNCLGNKDTIYAENGRIMWQYVCDLVNLQMKNNINLGNKLTKTHIQYHDKKMNVRIAAETCSLSSAISIDYVNKKLKLPEFANSEATSEYLRVANNLFDIMNSKRGHVDERFKRPLSETTVRDFTEYFDYARKYIKSLKLVEDGKVKQILNTRSYTPYFGFYYDTFSLIGIYNDYIKPNGYDEFYTFDISQDHLETFFGSIRSMGGNIKLII